jgi:hypothetical protein
MSPFSLSYASLAGSIDLGSVTCYRCTHKVVIGQWGAAYVGCDVVVFLCLYALLKRDKYFE